MGVIPKSYARRIDTDNIGLYDSKNRLVAKFARGIFGIYFGVTSPIFGINTASGVVTMANQTVNKDLILHTSGTGVIEFGTEITNAGNDRGKLVKMKTLAGDTVYFKTYDAV